MKHTQNETLLLWSGNVHYEVFAGMPGWPVPREPVEDTMAQADNLAAAMIIAPVAGIAAAVGKYVNRSKTASKGA